MRVMRAVEVRSRDLGAAVAGAVVLATAGGPAVASPMASDPLAVLSGASPFADGCGTGATTQRGAEAESHLAVAPRDPARLVAAWQQDRYRTSGTLATGVSMTAD